MRVSAYCFGVLTILALTAAMSCWSQQPPPMAESAAIPPRSADAAPAQQPLPEPDQKLVRTVPTLDEEMQAVLEGFGKAYKKAGRPRMLLLVNRDMEDNDNATMQKVIKTEGGVSFDVKSSKEGTAEGRAHGGDAVYVQKDPDPRAYRAQSLEQIREAFERPFTQGGVRLVDRDTAVRMQGIKEEEVFAYTDLPETKRAQVKGVKQFADFVITVRVERGTAVERRVSGDKVIEAPNIVAKAIRLSDAVVLATATTADVRAKGGQTTIASRVAMALMDRLRGAWGS